MAGAALCPLHHLHCSLVPPSRSHSVASSRKTSEEPAAVTRGLEALTSNPPGLERFGSEGLTRAKLHEPSTAVSGRAAHLIHRPAGSF